jgi:uncharacterized membrane protein (DUF106 family)
MIEFTQAGYAIAGISVVLAIFSTVVRLAVTDMKRSKEIREKLKEHQADIKAASKSNDTKKMQRAQKDMMDLTMENLRMGYKPLLITFIPFILIFGWIRGEYGSSGIVANILGFGLDWFGWYFVCAMITSLIINRITEKYPIELNLIKKKQTKVN